MTRVPEMLALGIRVGWGQDCVLDPWYSLGTADMLDVAFMGLHVAQMSSPADMARCFDMVTNVNAAIMGLDHLGLEPSASAPASSCSTPATRSRPCACAPSGCASSRRGKVVAERTKHDTAAVARRPAEVGEPAPSRRRKKSYDVASCEKPAEGPNAASKHDRDCAWRAFDGDA